MLDVSQLQKLPENLMQNQAPQRVGLMARSVSGDQQMQQLAQRMFEPRVFCLLKELPAVILANHSAGLLDEPSCSASDQLRV